MLHDVTAPSGPGPPHYRGITIVLRHMILGRTPLDERSDWGSDSYLTAHSSHKTQTSCTRRDSNRQSQQAIGLLESALLTLIKMNTQVYETQYVFIHTECCSNYKTCTVLCVWRLTGHYASVLKAVIGVQYTLAGSKLCYIYMQIVYNIAIKKNIYSELETLPPSVTTTCDGVFLCDLWRHVSASLKSHQQRKRKMA
jgi:hypothetical protein